MRKEMLIKGAIIGFAGVTAVKAVLDILTMKKEVKELAEDCTDEK